MLTADALKEALLIARNATPLDESVALPRGFTFELFWSKVFTPINRAKQQIQGTLHSAPDSLSPACGL